MKLPKELTTITPVSKILAGILFIALPFIGFFLGILYQEMLDLAKQSTYTVIPTPLPTQTSVKEDNENSNWKTYVNKKRYFSFKYPMDWKVINPGHQFGENNPESKYYSINYVNLMNKENTTYDIKPEVVIARIGESSKTNSFGEKWENLTDQEFYDTQGHYWKKGLDSHSVFGYTYSYLPLTKIANKKAITQVYHPTEYYESETPDQITYNYVLLIDNNVFYISFQINDKNPQKEEMTKIRDKILSTFRFD